MPHFDRFDICEAHLALENDYHVGGWLHQRPSNRRRKESTGLQLKRIGYEPGALWRGFESLEPNAKAIYRELEQRYGLVKPGYVSCACRDCFETTVGYPGETCYECGEAGCEADAETECCVEPDLEEAYCESEASDE